jgi:hypothetical protein
VLLYWSKRGVYNTMNPWTVAKKRQGRMFLSHPHKSTLADYEIAHW